VGSSGPLALVRLRDRFDWLSIKSVFYAVARLALLAGPALLGFGLAGVVVGAIIAEFINMASQMLMYILLWRKMPNTRLVDFTRPVQFAEGSKLLVNLWFSATLQALQLETFVPITALLTAPAEVGILRSAYDVSNLINSLIQPISIVLSPGIIKTYELSPGAEFRRLLKQATAILSVMVVPLTLGIVVLGPIVLPRLLGAAYEGVGTAAAFFAIGFGVNAVFSWLRPVVVAMKLVREQNIISLISVIISTAGLLFVAPRYGASGSSAVVGGTIAIYALVLFVVIRMRVRADQPSPPAPLPGGEG
jgi:O-antigen/teichoic acid export membrane protein